MSITLDRKIATGMIGRAKTGDELLAVLDIIIENFASKPIAEPTTEEIQF